MYGAITLYGVPFQTLPLPSNFVTLWGFQRFPYHVPQPRIGNAVGLSHQFGLGYSAFARRYLRSRFYFPFLRVLRCFNSPGSLSLPYVFRQE